MKTSNAVLSVVVSVLGLSATPRTNHMLKAKSLSSPIGMALATFTAVAASVLSSASALAVDGKVLPGSNCVRESGSTSIIYQKGGIGNNGTTTLYLLCPAIRDYAGIASGWVRVQDQHYSDPVTCALYSVYRNNTGGFTQWTWGPETSDGVGPDSLPFGAVSATSVSHYYYGCQVPPAYSGNVSYVDSYHVSEND